MPRTQVLRVARLLPEFRREKWPVDSFVFAQSKNGWYQARILAARNEPAAEPEYRVHFLGWNSHYDEWLAASQLLDLTAVLEHLESAHPGQKAAFQAGASAGGAWKKKGKKRGARATGLVLFVDPSIEGVPEDSDEQEEEEEESEEEDGDSGGDEGHSSGSDEEHEDSAEEEDDDEEEDGEDEEDEEEEEQEGGNTSSTPSSSRSKSSAKRKPAKRKSPSSGSKSPSTSRSRKKNNPKSTRPTKKKRHKKSTAKQSAPASRKKKKKPSGVDSSRQAANVAVSNNSRSRSDSEEEDEDDDDDDVASSAAAPSKVLEFKFPNPLRKQLVVDWAAVSKQQLVPLPRKINVKEVVNRYVQSKTQKSSRRSAQQLSAAKDFAVGLELYFNKTLPRMLLYSFERLQYRDSLSRHEGLAPSELYGAEHLLRMFVKLPDLVALAGIPQEDISPLGDIATDFLAFLNTQRASFFLPSYAKPTEEYLTKSRLQEEQQAHILAASQQQQQQTHSPAPPQQ